MRQNELAGDLMAADDLDYDNKHQNVLAGDLMPADSIKSPEYVSRQFGSIRHRNKIRTLTLSNQ